MKLKYFEKISPEFFASLGIFFDLVTIEYFASPIYTLLQYIAIVPAFLYCIIYIKKIRNSQWLILVMVSFISFWIMLSSFFNEVETYYLRASIYVGILYIILFIFCILLVKNKKFEIVGLAGKCFLIPVVFINDLLMIILPNSFYNISGRDIGTCLIGNKFSVAYAHLMLFFLQVYFEKDSKKRSKKIILYTFVMSVLCIYIECVTVLLATWLFLLLYFITPFFRKILSNTIVFIGCFFISAYLLIWLKGILSLDFVQYFIVNILHRDVTLTGRLEIYPYIFHALSSHQVFGYGYGTSIIKDLSVWFANTQNAFWDFVIRYGFITMITLLCLLFFIIWQYHKIQIKIGYDVRLWLNLSIIYVYIFIGIAEIVYNKHFFFYIALLNAYTLNYTQQGRQIQNE